MMHIWPFLKTKEHVHIYIYPMPSFSLLLLIVSAHESTLQHDIRKSHLDALDRRCLSLSDGLAPFASDQALFWSWDWGRWVFRWFFSLSGTMLGIINTQILTSSVWLHFFLTVTVSHYNFPSLGFPVKMGFKKGQNASVGNSERFWVFL